MLGRRRVGVQTVRLGAAPARVQDRAEALDRPAHEGGRRRRRRVADEREAREVVAVDLGVAEKHLEQGGDGEEMGHAVALDRRERLHGIRRLEDHRRAPRDPARVHEARGEVAHRRVEEPDVSGLAPRDLGPREHRRLGARVRVGHALGFPGRARGVEDLAELALRAADHGRLAGVEPQEVLVVEHAVASARRDHVPDVRKERAQRVRPGSERGRRGDQDPGSAVRHHVGVVGLGEHPEHRDEGRATACDAGERLHELVVVGLEHGDAVARPHAELDQRAGEPARAGVQRPVGEPRLALDDRGPFRIPPRRAAEVVRVGVNHGCASVSAGF